MKGGANTSGPIINIGDNEFPEPIDCFQARLIDIVLGSRDETFNKCILNSQMNSSYSTARVDDPVNKRSQSGGKKKKSKTKRQNKKKSKTKSKRKRQNKKR